MNEIIENNEELDVIGACAYLGIKSGMIYRAVAKNWLRATKREENGIAKYYFAKSDLDTYRSSHLENHRVASFSQRYTRTKDTAPLQSQSEPAELPPAAMQSLDPFDDPFDQAALPYSTTSFVEEDPEPVEESDGSEAQPSTPEVSPEIAMLSLVISQIRRKVAREEAEKFIEVLRRMRNVIVTTHAMQLMAIDNAIAECEVDDGDTSSQ